MFKIGDLAVYPAQGVGKPAGSDRGARLAKRGRADRRRTHLQKRSPGECHGVVRNEDSAGSGAWVPATHAESHASAPGA